MAATGEVHEMVEPSFSLLAAEHLTASPPV